MNTSRWLAKPAAFLTGDPGRLAGAGAIAVIGLGRFGAAVATELTALGAEVIGIDIRRDAVDDLRDRLAFVATADSTDEQALRQLGIAEVPAVVVGIGSDIEASILTTSRLLKLGVPAIWAKAIGEPHAEILGQLGVEHVIRPENDMGRRLAHLISSRLHDFAAIDEDFAVVRISPPGSIVDRPLGPQHLERHHGVAVVGVKRGGGWHFVEPETVVYPEDEILVAGHPRALESFSTLTSD